MDAEFVIEVDASAVTPSSCIDIEGAVDIDVTVRLGERSIDGEITLVPREADGVLDSWGGSPDYWMTGALLAELHRLSDADFRRACRELVSAGRKAAE